MEPDFHIEFFLSESFSVGGTFSDGLVADPIDVSDLQSTPTDTTSMGVNTTTFDPVAYLEMHLGSRRRWMVEAIVLTVLYVVILLTGVTGNVSTCIVIIKQPNMQTATNYYLFSLAISDVLTLILGLPPEMYTIWEAYPWRFGDLYCLFKTFLTETTSSASILTIAAFTVERFVAICRPLRAQAMSTLSRAVKSIVIVWVTAALTAIPFPAHTRTFYFLNYPGTSKPILESFTCNIGLDWVPRMRYVFQASTFLLFILPIVLITVLYVLIGIALRQSGRTRNSLHVTTSSNNRQTQSHKSVLKMLVAVVVAFFICWAPFHAQRLMTAYVIDWNDRPKLLEIQSYLFHISGILYYVSATVNPILYNLMSARYRKAFRETLCPCTLSPGVPKISGRNPPQRLLIDGELSPHTNLSSSPCADSRSVDRRQAQRMCSASNSECNNGRPVGCLTRQNGVSVECQLFSPCSVSITTPTQYETAINRSDIKQSASAASSASRLDDDNVTAEDDDSEMTAISAAQRSLLGDVRCSEQNKTNEPVMLPLSNRFQHLLFADDTVDESDIYLS